MVKQGADLHTAGAIGGQAAGDRAQRQGPVPRCAEHRVDGHVPVGPQLVLDASHPIALGIAVDVAAREERVAGAHAPHSRALDVPYDQRVFDRDLGVVRQNATPAVPVDG